MSGQIDRIYINYLSGRLERFRWIRDSVALCRCPICGDGHKGTRTRFYLYEDHKHGSYNFFTNCKNCGYSCSFHNFLKEFDSGLFNEYRLAKFRDKYGREPREMFGSQTETSQPTTTSLVTDNLDRSVKLSELPLDHPCIQYFMNRQIPYKYIDYLRYTDNFREMTAEFKNSEYAKKMPDDARLVLPFYTEFGELVAYQGRSLDPKDKIRYISVKKDESVVKTFGLDRIDRSKEVRVCEGPIDSLFIDNCLASADADLVRVRGDVYIFDNQLRNLDVVRHLNKAIEAGKRVVLFPPDFTYKDINQAVMEGVTLDEVESLIVNHTYQGLRAKLVLSKLKGC